MGKIIFIENPDKLKPGAEVERNVPCRRKEIIPDNGPDEITRHVPGRNKIGYHKKRMEEIRAEKNLQTETDQKPTHSYKDNSTDDKKNSQR